MFAYAVREYGNEKTSRVLRFIHSIGGKLREFLGYWVGVLLYKTFPNPLFTSRDDHGKIMPHVEEKQEPKDKMNCHLYKLCNTYFVAQRTAGWFMMRKFRITTTLASNIHLPGGDLQFLFNSNEI